MSQSSQDSIIDLLPWELDVPSAIATFAMYEHLKLPIILKNGAKMYPKGWLSFVRWD